jgi:hypothetical protein
MTDKKVETRLQAADARGNEIHVRPEDIAAFDADFDACGRIGITLKNGTRATLSLILAKAHGFRFREDAPPLDGGSVQWSALCRDWLLGLARKGVLTVPAGWRPGEPFMGGQIYTNGRVPTL